MPLPHTELRLGSVRFVFLIVEFSVRKFVCLSTGTTPWQRTIRKCGCKWVFLGKIHVNMATLLEDFRCRVDAADHHLFSDMITHLSAVKVTSVVDFTFLDADDLQMIFDGNTALLRVAEHINVCAAGYKAGFAELTFLEIKAAAKTHKKSFFQ